MPIGYSFVNWTVTAGGANATIANVNLANTTVTLSGGDATVQANFMKYPVITDVTILNQPMKIGDVVTANISTADDGGITYSLVSGTIGGYTLGNLIRVTSTTYSATFTIIAGGTSYTAGQAIPVANLVLTDGTLQSAPFAKSITQNNDPIDAKAPVINLVSVLSGNKKVGDQVVLFISADGTGYSINPASELNGIPVTASNMSFQEVGSGNYTLSYTVQEGDNDVAAGGLQASIILNDQVGNASSPVTTVQNVNQLTIDAHSPVVQQMQVPAGDIGPGGIVNITIHADGTGYTATNLTTINGISLSSSRVTFSEQSGGLYTLSYTVAEGDNPVSRGGLQVRVYLRDAAGNIGGPWSNLDPNSLLIYTARPTATISGTQSICNGDIATLTVSLTGKSPWSFKLFNGSTTNDYTDINTASYQIIITPTTTTTFTVTEVTDVNGVTNTGSGSAKVTVNARTDVQIINLAAAYNILDPPVLLEASISGGTFSGPGVNSSTGYFDPAVADTTNSPHTIFYTYTNPSGCVSKDSAMVFVLGAKGDIFIPKTVYCDFNDPFSVTAVNGTGTTGSFKLLDSAGDEVTGLTDNGNNTAQVNPQVLAVGNYTVVYEYVDIIPLSLTKDFLVETVSQPTILTPTASEYCQNAPTVALTSNISTAVFQGPGVTGTVGDGFFFNPSGANVGSNIITATSSSAHGCSKSVSDTIKINFAPNVDFSVDKMCISTQDTISFANATVNKDMVSGWSWNFGDPTSGTKNTSLMEEPEHVFMTGGIHTIRLIGETTQGCADTLSKAIQFHTRPVGSFAWASECFNEGAPTLFISQMKSTEPITKYEWTFVNSGGNITKNNNDSVYYTFNSIDNYTVRLYTETSGGCGDTAERVISLKPVIDLKTTFPYTQDFNSDNGFWTTDMADTSGYNSWDYSAVDYSHAGSNQTPAWHIVPPGNPVSEQSYIISPCFDFSSVEKPMITMDIYKSLEGGNEGVVLQAKSDSSLKWRNVGMPGDGINWYDSDQIGWMPAGQDTGWTGNSYTGTGSGWINARHDLDFLSGKTNVQFRLFYGSPHTAAGEEGFAFDNMKISSRTRNVLLEHFTNSSSSKSKTVDAEVNPLYNRFFDDVVKLEYHTEFPGNDPLNLLNPAMPATRVLFYGITTVPFSVLDGGTDNSLRFDYISSSLAAKDIKLQSLEDPEFNIDLKVTYGDNQLDADVTVTAQKELPQEERIIQVVIFEKLINNVNTINGESSFLNVTKDMLPNAAGTAVFDSWNKGQSLQYQYHWNYQNVFNADMVRVAAFIQSDISQEVYQAVTNDTSKITTGVKEIRLAGPGISIYPNPASDILNVRISPENHEKCIVEILDLSGRIVISEPMYENESEKQLGLNALNKGLYFVRVRNSRGTTWSVTKLVVMKN